VRFNYYNPDLPVLILKKSSHSFGQHGTPNYPEINKRDGLMRLPLYIPRDIHKISSATEVLHGLRPFASNVESNRSDLALERFEILGRMMTPRVEFGHQHLLAITWTGQIKEIGGTFRAVSTPNALSIFPAGITLQEQAMSEVDFTNLLLNPGFLNRVAGEMGLKDRMELLAQWSVRDEEIESIARAAEAEIRSGLEVGSLFIESLATALAAHVLARYSSNPVEIQKYRTGMSPSQLRRTKEFIEANLGEDCGLAELAANVQMSPYYFSRLFKQSTNYSPHQFVIRKRIERAQQLLREGRLPIVEIATKLGFSDQSHFARVFRSLVGSTPKRYASLL
jgi:AraC family transcriptional regulator